MPGTLSTANWLQGKRVALAGRLASMTHSEAARLIAAHGGIVARSIGQPPLVVVVGREGWPLAKDGRPRRKLRQAVALAEQGLDVEIVPEEELLVRLHNTAGQGGERWQRRSTLRELAEMLDVSVERLGAWMRAGLIKPETTIDGIHYFDFCQVAGAKSLCELVRSGITTARLRQSLEQLQTWLGNIERPLAQLTLLEDGPQLVVRLDNGQLAEPHGQLLFDFSPDTRPASVPWVGQVHSADDWFELGCQAEELGNLRQAATAYRQALLVGGPRAHVAFNLANVLYALGQYARAGERYRQVLELDANFWEAWNNLGTVLTYDDQNEEAVVAYRQALRLNPQYSDAHYNLADTLEDLGRAAEAREHWQAYLDLEPRGEWAEHARDRLRPAMLRR